MSTSPPVPAEPPRPCIDPPEPTRPDEIDTWSPGLTDESGVLPVSDRAIAHEIADEGTDVAASEPTG